MCGIMGINKFKFDATILKYGGWLDSPLMVNVDYRRMMGGGETI